MIIVFSLILIYYKVYTIYVVSTVIFVKVPDKKFSTQQQQPPFQEVETIPTENGRNHGKYI